MDSLLKNKIKEIRQLSGIDQHTLAKVLGITRTYLSKIETNKHQAGPVLMAKICKYFKKELGEIFYITEICTSPKRESEGMDVSKNGYYLE